jgi:hypothetical protein
MLIKTCRAPFDQAIPRRQIKRTAQLIIHQAASDQWGSLNQQLKVSSSLFEPWWAFQQQTRVYSDKSFFAAVQMTDDQRKLLTPRVYPLVFSEGQEVMRLLDQFVSRYQLSSGVIMR